VGFFFFFLYREYLFCVVMYCFVHICMNRTGGARKRFQVPLEWVYGNI